MKKVKVILWDFDGTLLNSTKESMRNMRKIARSLRLKVPMIELLQKYWGIPWYEFVTKIAHDCGWREGAVDLFVTKCRGNKERWRKHKLFEGTNEILSTLISHNIKTGIVSTRIRESAGGDLFSIMDYFRALNINSDIFFLIQGREDCPYIKPDPMVFKSILARLKEEGINSGEVIYAGDTMYDFKAALDYIPSLSFVGITSGACAKNTFLQAGVPEECIIKSPKKILGAIKFLESI